ncbi:MAG: putative nucleotidyltransferase substrate binding domain-containing protein [Pseudomonadota bacterium]
METADVRAFLATVPALADLPEAARAAVAGRLHARYLRTGEAFPPAEPEGETLYLLRTGAVELTDDHGRLLDRLDEGALAGACDGVGLQGRVVEDALVYGIPCVEVQRLATDHTELAGAIAAGERDRLRAALSAARNRPGPGGDLAGLAVGDLLKRPAATIAADAPIREAAAAMAREGVSSLLLTATDGRLAGIVTDRDLRNRCLAAGRDPGEPVAIIATTDPVTVTPRESALEALMAMTRLGVHHLPVVRDGQPAGVISSGDLLRLRAGDALYLVGDVRRAEDRTALTGVGARLRELQPQMVAAGADAGHVTRAVTAVAEAVTRRLTELAETELTAERGPAPVDWAWITCGSVARGEATAGSDQDNGLVLLEEPDADGWEWFAEFARRVSDGLDAAGFPYCPGNIMATNPDWCQPLSTWRAYFHRWTHEPEPRALMHASIFFDLAVTAGTPTAQAAVEELRTEVLAWTADHSAFRAALAGNALTRRPPLGFFRQFVVDRSGAHANTLDLKRDGLIPIVDLARIHALAAGIPANATVDRLRELGRVGAMNTDDAAELADAFALLGDLRIHHQAEALRAGGEPDNHLDPAGLSRLERHHLKDAFRIIQTHQSALAQRYEAGRFG